MLKQKKRRFSLKIQFCSLCERAVKYNTVYVECIECKQSGCFLGIFKKQKMKSP